MKRRRLSGNICPNCKKDRWKTIEKKKQYQCRFCGCIKKIEMLECWDRNREVKQNENI